MRDYAIVSPKFWTGQTGMVLKEAGPEAVIVALYLMTSPHANMIGVYHCPIAYIAIDTGLSIEGASKGLASAIDAGFCTFDADANYVFVREFAAYQVGSKLEPSDKRCIGVRNALNKVPHGKSRLGFQARYTVSFNLPKASETSETCEAPVKPLVCQEQEQEQKKEIMSPAKPPTVPDCPHQGLISLFVAAIPELPRPKPELWGGKNAEAMRSRWKWVLTAKRENGDRYATTEAEALDWFSRFFTRVGASDFLTGRDGKWSACDLGWLMKPDNFAKVVQGNYTNKESS